MAHSLRKSKNIFRRTYHLFQRKKKHLPLSIIEKFQSLFLELKEQIDLKDRAKASTLAKLLQEEAKLHLKKTVFEQTRDFISSAGVALLVAVVVRSMWFEPYEIPTGSMRPTLKEKDRLLVSKTAFGINVPLTPKHFYFDEALVKRGGIITFTGEDMDIEDVDTMYFYLFPGKKQFVKRLMGKPGDTLYFYGGKIYGIDRHGNDISKEFDRKEFAHLEYIPFIHLEGKMVTSRDAVTLYQMNQPIARLTPAPFNMVRSEMLTPHAAYSDLWGFKNYAMARLLTKEEVLTCTNHTTFEEAPLYLQLIHHPSIKGAKIEQDTFGKFYPFLSTQSSLIPLKEQHLKTLMDHLYTARFVVKNGIARSYSLQKEYVDRLSHYLPRLDIPDGCYEFYHGIAYKINFEGIASQLEPDHPIYKLNPSHIQLLFNLGIQFDTRFAPHGKSLALLPSRYAYFREDDLYLMGAPLLKKDDPTLVHFLNQEELKPIAFKDDGPPLNQDGTIDKDQILKYGLKIPDKHYLALGDNHAMSADSRHFGFVPEDNLRGAPSFLFWPPGSRFGFPEQTSYSWFTIPNLSIWAAASLSFFLWYWFVRRREFI